MAKIILETSKQATVKVGGVAKSNGIVESSFAWSVSESEYVDVGRLACFLFALRSLHIPQPRYAKNGCQPLTQHGQAIVHYRPSMYNDF